VLTGFSAVASDVTAQVALRTRLEAIVAALAEGLVLLDVNGNIVDCNTRAEQILGVRKEDLIGRSGVGPEWDARSEAGARIPDWQFPVTQVLQSGQPVRGFLMGVMRPDGERRWIEINAQLLKDGLGGIIGVVTSFADITERRQMQQAILESEARFRALADAAPMMVWLAGPTGEWADCNRIWQDFTGLALSRGVPWGWTSAIHPEDREFCLKKYSEAFRNRCSEEIEFRLRRRDGVYRWVLDRFNPRYGPAGDFQGFVGGCVDITGRREMEEQLRQANLRARHMALAVEQAPASIFLCDCDGLITYVNSTFCKVTGYQPEEVIGKNPRILQSGQTPRAVYQQMWANLTSGKPWRGEVLNRKKNGELYWELMLLAPLTDDSGATAGYLCVKEDITESKRNAEEIQDANRRLEQAMLRAQELACQAEAANVSKSEFLANMSHEIRTPMNGILGTAGLLLETELDAEQREHVETICASSESLLKIINDLLDFSKIEAGKLELETIELPVRDIVSGVAATLSPLAQRKGLLLRTSIDPDIPPVVLGDPGRLRQILVNLVGNAVKFTEAGEVSIEACRVDSTFAPELGPVREPAGLMVRFTVRDTGIGIPQDQIDRLFDEFTQLDASTTRRFGGTGLGLSISRRLVQMMGGQIGAQSQLGKGSEFWFTIQFGLPSPTGESASFTPHTAASLAAVRPNPNRHGRRSVCKQCKETVAAAQGLERASAEYSHGSVQNRKPDHGAPGRADSRVRETGCGLESLDEARIVERASSAPAQATGGMLASREPNANGSGLAAPRSPLQRYHVDPHLIRAIAERKATILLAEDNTINRRVAMGILKKFGIVTHTAENGQQAVDALQRRSFDLVLMDVHMPGMDGLEATRAIRALAGPNSRTPIIAMTASVMPEDRNSCLQAGMNDFVSKPVDLAALAEVLNRWLAASVESGGEAGDRPELSVR
jgi:PAS domain S-box-containing protein